VTRDGVLLAACLLWVVGLFVGQDRNRHFLIGYLALACLIGAWHVGANQYRWQLVPAYLFLLFASIAAAVRIGSVPRRQPPRWRRIVVRVLLVLALVVTLGLPLWLFPEIRYAAPTGPFPVGTRTEVWVDSARAETITPDPADRRRLLVQIWYPADPVSSAPRVRAHPYPRILAQAMADGLPGVPAFVFSSLGRGLTWAREGVPVSGAERSFPLLLFSHGFGASRAAYGFMLPELASHGYVVAAVEHTHFSNGTVFPDSTIVNLQPENARVLASDSAANVLAGIWAEDGRFVIDRMFGLARQDPRRTLAGRIDTTRVGYWGHSFGGATAANVMALDSRVQTGINLDGYLAGTGWVNGLDRPFLQVRSDSIDISTIPEEALEQVGLTRESLRRMLEDWKVRTRSVTRSGGYDVHLEGSAHGNYSDLPLWSPLASRMSGQSGPVDIRRAHRIINRLTVEWFDRILKGKGRAVEQLQGEFPELRVVSGADRTKG
jgi:hypothetical protein